MCYHHHHRHRHQPLRIKQQKTVLSIFASFVSKFSHFLHSATNNVQHIYTYLSHRKREGIIYLPFCDFLSCCISAPLFLYISSHIQKHRFAFCPSTDTFLSFDILCRNRSKYKLCTFFSVSVPSLHIVMDSRKDCMYILFKFLREERK